MVGAEDTGISKAVIEALDPSQGDAVVYIPLPVRDLPDTGPCIGIYSDHPRYTSTRMTEQTHLVLTADVCGWQRNVRVSTTA